MWVISKVLAGEELKGNTGQDIKEGRVDKRKEQRTFGEVKR